MNSIGTLCRYVANVSQKPSSLLKEKEVALLNPKQI
jgi:hypothetical protein